MVHLQQVTKFQWLQQAMVWSLLLVHSLKVNQSENRNKMAVKQNIFEIFEQRESEYRTNSGYEDVSGVQTFSSCVPKKCSVFYSIVITYILFWCRRTTAYNVTECE